MSTLIVVTSCGRCGAPVEPVGYTTTCGHDWVEPAVPLPPQTPAPQPKTAVREQQPPADPTSGPPESVPEVGAVGVLLSNGERYAVRRALLLGRSPEHLEGRSPAGHALLTWPDLSRRLASTHLLLERDETSLWATDLRTASGTAVVAPDGRRTPLPPGVAVRLEIGAVLELGGRTATVVGGPAYGSWSARADA